ncbi:MAG TPA: flagellar biosynthetic protein FliO [Symbiobacteriaceae bacterium]|nr:flagellar biosynthetic protein FliO [Symbiobacteriaceae bacterium]
MTPGSGLLTFLFASLAVIGLTYYASRLLANWQAVQSRGRRLRVLEGVPIGKDRHLLLVAVGKEVLVVGASGGNVSLVHRIEDPAAAAELLAQQAAAPADQFAPVSLAKVEEQIQANLGKMRSLLARRGGGPDA